MEGDVSVYFRVVLVGFIVHLVAGSSCSDTSLGMESGKILDNKISASSEDSAKPAKNGRLNYTTGQSWCAATQDSNQYLQIDLGTNYIICAVATQGNSQADQWVKTYQLETSSDGTAWTKYKDGGQDKVFAAKFDRDTIVKHILLKGIVAKLIRFLPKSHNGLVCLRAEVFGINRQLENAAFNKTATQSSATNGALGAALAVDGIPGGQCSTTTASTNPWWQVDLGEIAVVYEVNIMSQASPEKFKVRVGGTLCEGTLKIPDGGPLSIVCSNKPIHNVIKISVQGNNKVLTLCEVQVFLKAQAESAVNLALNKPAKQSSTRSASNGCNLASCAVDGNRDNDFLAGKSCSHTEGGKDNPWWRVDLGTVQPVSRVYVVNKIQYPESLSDFEVRIGNTDGEGVVSNPRCGYKYSAPGSKALNIYCDLPMHGRYVYIRIPGQRKTLSMCEVEVYSDGNVESVNLALNKPANQSSTRVASIGGNVASTAVDGNRDSDFVAGRSCSHTGTSVADQTDPWWRVDLGTIQPVSRVNVVNRNDEYYYSLSNFELRIGNSDTIGGTLNPKCGDTYSVPRGEALNIYCNPAMYGRYVYIRIPGSGKFVVLCEVEVYSDDKACSNQAIGTTNSASFPDSRWTASSSKSGNEPYKAQLEGAGAWIPSTNSGADYLQIDLGAVYFICAVATQGNPKKDEWTKTYKIEMSLNKVDWTVYQEASSEKVLTGNADRNSIVKYNLVGLNKARFVRFVPVKYNGKKTLRIKIYGILQVPAEAPTLTTVKALTSQSIQVTWLKPGKIDGALDGYKVLYRKTGQGNFIPKTLPGAATSHTLSSLEKWTEYEVKVKVYNSKGDSPGSVVKTVRTLEDVPERAPNTINVKALTSVSIQVTWQKPDKINGPLVGYKVLYRKKGQASFITKTLTGAATSHTLISLEKWTEYEVKVQVYNSKGDSPASDVKTVRTLKDGHLYIIDLPSVSYFISGRVATLLCETSGNPEPKIVWSKNGDDSIPEVHFQKGGALLVFTPIQTQHSGVYKCTATNTYGSTSTSTNVTVIEPPRLIKEQSTTHVVCALNTTVVLHCYATSVEHVSYSWSKEGKLLTTDSSGNNLLIVRLQSDQDFGTYTCNMTNRAGSTEHHIQLEELKQPIKESEKFGQKDAVFSSPVIWAVGGTLLFIVLVLIIVVACLILKLKRNHASNKKYEEARMFNDSPHNPSDTRTYVDLQPAVQTYQSLDSSSAIRPNETYEEVPMSYVNVNSEKCGEVRSTNA